MPSRPLAVSQALKSVGRPASPGLAHSTSNHAVGVPGDGTPLQPNQLTAADPVEPRNIEVASFA